MYIHVGVHRSTMPHFLHFLVVEIPGCILSVQVVSLCRSLQRDMLYLNTATTYHVDSSTQ